MSRAHVVPGDRAKNRRTTPHLPLLRSYAAGLLLVAAVLTSSGCVELVENLQTTVDRFDAMEADIVVQTDPDESTTTMSIAGAVARHDVNGMTIVLIEDGVITVRRHYGLEHRADEIPTDSDTVYQAASMSKFVASVALLHAARNGVDLDLQTTVEEVADEHPDSLVARWRRAKFNRKTDDYPAQIDFQRLLSHTAGLSKHGIGTETLFYNTSLEAILMGQSFLNIAATRPVHAPGTRYDYSGGGYSVAEAMLEAISGRSATDVLNDHLFQIGLTRSTWSDASESTPHLARGCSRTPCLYDVRHTEVKFAGGLLAHPVDYAKLLTYIARDGRDDRGRERIHPDDLRALLTPAWRGASTLAPCSADSECPAVELALFNLELPQRCLVDRCRAPIDRAPANSTDQWYGLGVRFGSAMYDGLPRRLEHGGAQDGFSTRFKLDRATGNGVVVMINGSREWKSDDVTFGGAALLDDVIDAWDRHYG